MNSYSLVSLVPYHPSRLYPTSKGIPSNIGYLSRGSYYYLYNRNPPYCIPTTSSTSRYQECTHRTVVGIQEGIVGIDANFLSIPTLLFPVHPCIPLLPLLVPEGTHLYRYTCIGGYSRL